MSPVAYPEGQPNVSIPTSIRVLVVEDRPTDRDAIELALSASGYVVDLADNGEDALRHLEEDTYDLLVTDLLMPGVSGFDILTTLSKRGMGLPVVVVSAYVTPEVYKCLKLHERLEVVKKPYKIETLIEVVQSLLAS